MLISLAFVFLLTPIPSLQASIGERRNSTKPMPHAINLNVLPKPVTSALSLKPKTQSSPAAAAKASDVSPTPSPSAKPAGTNNAQKASADNPPLSSTITVIISEGCIQKEPQKDAVANTTRVQQVELTIKPGSPLVMTHHISLEISTCSGNCEAEMETLKGRVELLEKEMAALKKKCALCSEEQCPNNCSGQGRCERGQCLCLHGFSGSDCSKGIDKKTKLTVETVVLKVSESDTVKQETTTGKKTKADKMILEKNVDDAKEPKKDKRVEPTAKPSTNKTATATSKDLGSETKSRKESHVLPNEGNHQEQSTRGKAPVTKMESDKQSQTDLTIKVSSKQESAEKLSTKQEKLKDMPVNPNVTQSTEKRSNGTSKVLSSLAKGAKASANVTVKASSGKGKLPQSNVTATESDKKVVIGEALRPTVKKQGNGTLSIEKDKTQLQGTTTLPKDGSSGKKKADKQVDSTSTIEKDKTQLPGNATLPKDGSFSKKKAHKQVDSTSIIENDKTQLPGNATLPKDGSSSQKKVDKQVDSTSTIEKVKTQLPGNATLPKDGSSSQKKADKQVDSTSTIEKDKPQLPGNATLPKDGSSSKKKADKQVVSTSTIEKDKTQVPGNATLPKDGSSSQKKADKQVDSTSTIEKVKTQLPGNATLPKDGSSSQKKVDKQVDSTSTIEKVKTQVLGNATLPKDGSSSQKKADKQVDSTSTIEKVKTQLPGNATLPKDGSSSQKKADKQVDSTYTIEKDKTQVPGNATLPKDGLSSQKKADKQVDSTSTIEKVKTQLPGNATLPKDGSSSKKRAHKQVDSTSTIEKVKTQLPGNARLPKDGSSSQKKADKQVDSTSTIEKVKTQLPGNATLPKDGSSRQKKADKQVDLTFTNEKVKTQLPGNATLPKDGLSSQKKANKQVDSTFTIEKGKVQRRGNATLSKDGSSSQKKADKQVGSTSTIEKVKTQLSGNATLPKDRSSSQKKADKQVHSTSTIEKGEVQLPGNATLPKDGSSIKKKADKHVDSTSTIEKVKTQLPGNATLPKDGSSSKKKADKEVDSTSKIEKVKTQLPGNATLPKDGSSSKKKADKEVDSTSKIEKGKVQLPGNATLPKGKKKENQVDIISSVEKDQIQLKANATLSKEGKKNVEKKVHVTTSIEKDKKHHHVNATLLIEEASGKKKVENRTASTEKDKKSQQAKEVISARNVNVTILIDKNKKQHQVNTTLLKEETSGKKTAEKHVSITTSSGKKKGNTITVSDDKHKKQLQGNITADLGEKAAGKEKLEGRGHITGSPKDKTLQQSSETTALKEGGAKKKKVEGGVDVMVSTEKDKFPHANATTPSKGATSGKKKVEKHVNMTASTEHVSQVHITHLKEASAKKKVDATITGPAEKDKKQLQVNVTTSQRDSMKKKVEGGAGTTNAEAKTTKLDLGSVDVHNITATGFVITWEAPQGAVRNFTITRREVLTVSKDDDDAQEADDKGTITGNEASKAHSGKADRRTAKKFSQVLSGSARSFHFRNLQPQTRHIVSLYSTGPGGPSKLQRLFVSTGPEPPTELKFTNITETSLSVSWTKPKSIVTGFRVTYTNAANGETGSMSVDSQLSHVLLSKLSAGSSYEISVRSLLETIESEPTTASVITVPDPPTDLQAVNITDSKALLIWKPAQAKVDHYVLSYGSAKSPNVTVTVMLSGNSVEHQMRGLHRFTLYTVRIISQINNLQSRSISTIFSTTSGVKLQAGTPTEVTFNSAVISWKSPRLAFRSYRLTYQLGEDIKEVILNPSVTRYELTDLVAFSNYTVKVDGESEGQYINVVSTAFTTAQVPNPFPTDCSQVQLNGVKESGEAEIYPEGKDGEPVWVYCDMETEGGGWTVFQRRVDGSTDFFRGWKDYSKGFGFLNAEFWLGNDILHSLTSLTPMSLRIDLRSGNDTAYAHYSNFTVGPEANHYTIALSGYSGTAGDSMRYHNGRPFSTKDKDPNPLSIHCAKAYMGGWWYKNCYKANLNGLYATFSENQGVVWIDWKGKDASIPFTEMKLRPASLNR